MYNLFISKKYFATLILLLMCIMIQMFMVADFSIPLITLMSISSLLLIFNVYKIKKSEIPLWWGLMLIVTSALLNIESFRLYTVIYSFLFVFTFIYFTRLIYTNIFTIEYYKNILIFILFSYFIVLLIQQISVIIHLPVFNLVLYNENRFKLNSLSLEPSHTARIITIILFSYIRIKEIVSNKNYNLWKSIKSSKTERMIWIAYFYMIVTMQSSLGFIAMFLLLGYLFIKRRYVIFLPIIIIVGYFFFSSSDIYVVQRVKNVIDGLIKFNAESIKDADISASARIVPYFLYFKTFNFFSLNTWFGYGIDYSLIISNEYFFGIQDKRSMGFGGGFFPTMAIDYGLITFLMFLWGIKNMCFKNLISYEFLLWIILFFASPFNTYVFWFSLMLLSVNKYFIYIQNKKSYEENNYLC